MVRTAVKTLTLNVYAIPLPAVQQFVTTGPAAAYFAELATYLAEQCQVAGGQGAGRGSGAGTPACELSLGRLHGLAHAALRTTTCLPVVSRRLSVRPPPAPVCCPLPHQVLDRLLSSWDVASPQAQGSVEGCLAEVEDLLSYCNDVLMTGGGWGSYWVPFRAGWLGGQFAVSWGVSTVPV